MRCFPAVLRDHYWNHNSCEGHAQTEIKIKRQRGKKSTKSKVCFKILRNQLKKKKLTIKRETWEEIHGIERPKILVHTECKKNARLEA